MVHDFTIRVNISYFAGFLRGDAFSNDSGEVSVSRGTFGDPFQARFKLRKEKGLTLYGFNSKSSKSEAFQCSRRSVVDLTTKCLALRAKRCVFKVELVAVHHHIFNGQYWHVM